MKINTILNKEILILKMLLSLSFATNGYFFIQLQNQNLYIETLLEKNNSLITSIAEMQQSLNSLEQKQLLISNPVINTASDTFLKHPLFVIGALTLGIGATCYASTVIVSKVSALSFYPTLKFHNLSSLLAKLPFYIQEQTYQVYLGDLIKPVTIFIKILGDNIQGIEFRYGDEDDCKDIHELFRDLERLSGQQTNPIGLETINTAVSNSLYDIMHAL